MAARITRAKKKIAQARIPTGPRPRRSCPNGSTACSPPSTCSSAPATPRRPASSWSGDDVCDRAVDLARTLARCCPASPRSRGLLGAAAAHRRAPRRPGWTPTAGWCCSRTRTAAAGTTPRSSRALRWCARPSPCRPPGRFALQAAIAGVHAVAPSFEETDWPRIVRALRPAAQPCGPLRSWRSTGRPRSPSPRAPDVGLAELDRLARDGRLAGYPYLPAARADLLRRLGRDAEAAAAYEAAMALTTNAAEREFLARRRAELSSSR